MMTINSAIMRPPTESDEIRATDYALVKQIIARINIIAEMEFKS